MKYLKLTITLITLLLLQSQLRADEKVIANENYQSGQLPNGWNIAGNTNGYTITKCGEDVLLGGFNAFGAGAVASKKFRSSVSQKKIRVEFDLFAIDSWDSEAFFVAIDGVQKNVYSTYIWTPKNSEEKGVDCGNWYNSSPFYYWGKQKRISVEFDNSNLEFELRFSSSLDEYSDNESWGIKNLKITAIYSPLRPASELVIAEENYQVDQKPSGWTVSGNTNDLSVTQCGSDVLLGGGNAFGAGAKATKKFTSPVQQKRVRVEFDLFAIDSWDSENFVVTLDGVSKNVYSTNFRFGLEQDESRIGCGYWNTETLYGRQTRVSVEFENSNQTFELSFSSTLDQASGDESWGIKNLRVTALYNSKCHASCNCKDNQSICDTCVDSNSIMVDQKFCYCDYTKNYYLQNSSPFKCYKPIDGDANEIDACELELFNFITTVKVQSQCSGILLDNTNYVQDLLSFNFEGSGVSPKCQEKLKSQLLISKNGENGNYSLLDNKYINQQSNTLYQINIPLIDLYDLASKNEVRDNQIYQQLNLAVELGHQRKYLRQHRFSITVYTNRNVVSVIALDISKQITGGECKPGDDPVLTGCCTKDEACTIVTDLNIQSNICSDLNCSSFLTKEQTSFKVSDYIYVKISFVDPSYTKFLDLVKVYYKNEDGLVQNFTPVSNVVDRKPGFVVIKTQLLEPGINGILQYSLKINSSRLRFLEATADKVVQTNVSLTVESAGNKANSLSDAETKTSFGNMIGFSTVALALILNLFI